VRPADVVESLAGGRFVVFLPNADVYVATMVAGRMLDALDAPVHLDGAEVRVAIAVGVDASDDRTLEEQVAAADAALDRARATGSVEVAR
jgi:GGDEF domain-containing protein